MFDLKLDSFESSNLSEIEFAPEHNILRVTFKGGTKYLYYGIPESVFNALRLAESKGSVFNKLVKVGGYKYEKENEK
jgi:hypothetical protein